MYVECKLHKLGQGTSLVFIRRTCGDLRIKLLSSCSFQQIHFSITLLIFCNNGVYFFSITFARVVFCNGVFLFVDHIFIEIHFVQKLLSSNGVLGCNYVGLSIGFFFFFSMHSKKLFLVIFHYSLLLLIGCWAF